MDPAVPAPDDALVHQLAQSLREAVPGDWTRISAQWSQAGTQHSGRAYVTDSDGQHRIALPDAAIAAFAGLRTQMGAPGVGAWLSASIDLTPDGPPQFHANYDRRPNWAAPGVSIVEAGVDAAPGFFSPQGVAAPVPPLEQWLADLKRHPRDRAHLPEWLAPDTVEGEAIAELRTALDSARIPRAAVVLPGEPAGPTFEGTLEVVRFSAAAYALRVSDYGQHHHLGDFRSERGACVALWHYLTAYLPAPRRIAQHELDERNRSAQRSYHDLVQRLRNVGQGGFLTNLAPGLAYDRLGGIDGLYFFASGTPWEHRSLPPTAWADGARLITFVALTPVEVQAELVPPWFGQPGGGVRFHVEGGMTMRDLVRNGLLTAIETV